MMVKVSYGYNEPEEATTEILGTYESWDEAAAAAEDKFDAIKERLGNDLEVRFGETEGSQYDYYDAIGDHTVECGRVFSGVDYCKVSIIEL